VLIRQTAPVIGANGSPYSPPGEWQINLSTRDLRSTDHYSQAVEQIQRQTLGTNVVNIQNSVDLTVGYQKSERLGFTVGVPFLSASWSIPTPTGPTPGPRAQQDTRGIGDISAAARYWVLNTRSHLKGNIGIGLGVKAPTGTYNAQDMYPDSTGKNDQLRYVDQSIQPGDGGWGITTEIQAFHTINRAMIFASGNYLINPRNTNGTPSLTVARLAPGAVPAASNYNKLVNSVPDQYLVRTGGSLGLGRGLAASFAWRVEGMPRYDLLGRSDGFRRPGLEMFVEPGISYSTGRGTLSFNVPIGFYRDRKLDPYTNLAGDATFPNYIALGSYSVRFGGHRPFQRTPVPALPDDSAATPELAAAFKATPVALPLPARGQAAALLDISGMTCDHCVDVVREALHRVNGVQSAEVNLTQQQASVVYDPAKTDVRELVEAVRTSKGMNAYDAQAVSARVTLTITGMTCALCVESVRSALLAAKGVTEATVTLQPAEAVVTYDPSKTKVADLVGAVKKAKGMNRYSAEVQKP
jgi:copper ion binding protein